jgi:hypothetical protein
MKGRNKLVLCEAALIEIMQDWLNRHLCSESWKVTGVEVSSTYSANFTFLLDEKDEKSEVRDTET